MKIYFLIITIVLLSLASAAAQQTSIQITNGTSLFVPNGAEICADSIIVHAGGSFTTENPNGICTNAIVTGGIEAEIIPSDFSLSQNYPNPFNPATTINYSIPELSNVVIKVYDVLGDEVAILVNEQKPAGSYEVQFDASKLSSGVYYYKIQAGNYIETRKMILLK